MDFTQLSTLVAACIASAGGISVIILAVIRLSSSIITERLSAKFENKLEKALETHKTELNRKEYVSKTRFDAEFKMYQELSEKKYLYGLLCGRDGHCRKWSSIFL